MAIRAFVPLTEGHPAEGYALTPTDLGDDFLVRCCSEKCACFDRGIPFFGKKDLADLLTDRGSSIEVKLLICGIIGRPFFVFFTRTTVEVTDVLAKSRFRSHGAPQA